MKIGDFVSNKERKSSGLFKKEINNNPKSSLLGNNKGK